MTLRCRFAAAIDFRRRRSYRCASPACPPLLPDIAVYALLLLLLLPRAGLPFALLYAIAATQMIFRYAGVLMLRFSRAVAMLMPCRRHAAMICFLRYAGFISSSFSRRY